MKRSSVAELYRSYVEEQQLERAGLFEAIKRRYDCATVLYPGSWIHVTPSFYFQHVVYVDRSDASHDFFAAEADVLALIQRRKQYEQAPYIRFCGRDFTGDLPLAEGSFDLLISLYAGGIARSCWKYLRIGGLLLTNNHHDDAGEAARNGELELCATVEEHGSKYQIEEQKLDGYFVPKQQPRRMPGQKLGAFPEYTKNAAYYVFRRGRPSRRAAAP